MNICQFSNYPHGSVWAFSVKKDLGQVHVSGPCYLLSFWNRIILFFHLFIKLFKITYYLFIKLFKTLFSFTLPILGCLTFHQSQQECSGASHVVLVSFSLLSDPFEKPKHLAFHNNWSFFSTYWKSQSRHAISGINQTHEESGVSKGGEERGSF